MCYNESKAGESVNTYLFDFDGTLVDSMPTYISAMLRILDDHGIPYEKDIVKIITPLGFIGTAEYFIDKWNGMIWSRL